MKLALDFASRMVTSTESEYVKNKESLLKGVNKLLDTTEERFPKNLFETSNVCYCLLCNFNFYDLINFSG